MTNFADTSGQILAAWGGPYGVGTGNPGEPASAAPYVQQGKQIAIRVFPGSTASAAPAGAVHTLVLPLAADTIQVTWPFRTTLTQTITGAYVDDFNLGIPQLQMTGNTGWRHVGGSYNGGSVDGFAAFNHLADDILLYYFLLESYQATQEPRVTMEIINAIDENYFLVKPTGDWQPHRNKAQPLLFQWSMAFIVLADLAHQIQFQAPIPDPLDPLLPTRGLPTQPSPVTPAPSRPVSHAPARTQQPPPTRIYVVKAGDTLWSIATQYYGHGTDDTVIAHANGIANPNLIYIGQRLVIPYL